MILYFVFTICSIIAYLQRRICLNPMCGVNVVGKWGSIWKQRTVMPRYYIIYNANHPAQ